MYLCGEDLGSEGAIGKPFFFRFMRYECRGEVVLNNISSEKWGPPAKVLRTVASIFLA